MTYNNLYTDFKTLFPEYAETFDSLQSQNLIDMNDGMHIAFGLVVIPFIVQIFDNDDVKNISKVFDFFEQMATTGDPLICEVLEFTVLEDLISRGNPFLNKCKKYMKQETLKSCEAVEEWLIVN